MSTFRGSDQNAQKLNSTTAINRGGVNRVIEYTEDIFNDPSFNELIQAHHAEDVINPTTRGCGYWVWKPFIIREALQELAEGDYLIYADAGCAYVDSVSHLIEVMDANKLPVMSFSQINLYSERAWSKRDAYILMDCDKEAIVDSPQRVASYVLLKKCADSCDLIDAYLEYCLDRRIVSDEPNVMGTENYEGFCENRHDQTVWSLLCKKMDIPAFREPSQYGNKTEMYLPEVIERSPYPQIFFHHRKRYLKTERQLFLYGVKYKIDRIIESIF